MIDGEMQAGEPIRPHLWNPNTAANWCLLFTPAFGAYLHAVNWRELGKPERASRNMIWVWITACFLVINVGLIFTPLPSKLDFWMYLPGICLLFSWYFAEGRPQVRYVQETLGRNYVKKSWGRPLLVGTGCFVAYFLLASLLVFVVNKPDSKDLADVVKPMILQEWKKNPQIRDASIRNVSLSFQGGNRYTGFVEAVLNGQPETYPIDITLDGQMIRWQLKPPRQ